jgi:hypothetical protein
VGFYVFGDDFEQGFLGFLVKLWRKAGNVTPLSLWKSVMSSPLPVFFRILTVSEGFSTARIPVFSRFYQACPQGCVESFFLVGAGVFHFSTPAVGIFPHTFPQSVENFLKTHAVFVVPWIFHRPHCDIFATNP